MVVAVERSWHNGEKTSILQQHHINWDHNESSNSCKRSIKFQFQGMTPCKDKWNVLNSNYKTLRIITKVLETIFFLGVIFWREKKNIYLNNITTSIMK